MMDFPSLDSARLLQGGEPYHGNGWSLVDAAAGGGASGGGGADVTDGGSIQGPSSGSTVGGGSLSSYSESVPGGGGGGYYNSTGGYYDCGHSCGIADRHPLPVTPLDPLLTYLRGKYASSAGPQDVLASSISTEELEFLLNETTAAMAPTGGGGGGGASSSSSSGGGGGGRGGQRPPTATTMGGIEVAPAPFPNLEFGPVASSWAADGARAATPLASGAGVQQQQQRPVAASTMTATSQHTSVEPIAPSNADTAAAARLQRRRRSRMPAFCRSPPCHVDDLLQTTPHLRHLVAASTDMSGAGAYDESKNIFVQVLSNFGKRRSRASSADGGGSVDPSSSSGGGGSGVDYHTSVLRRRANRRASSELASFLRLLSNEMPQEEFASVESEVYSKVFSLVHSKSVRADDRLAGVAALDALLAVPSADEERRAIRFGNNLSNGLKAPHADYEFLGAIARALGRMATGAANVDRVEFEIGRSLEWLRSERGDRRLAAALVLRELARCAPTVFYSRTRNADADGLSSVATRDGSGHDAASHLAVAAGGTNDFLDHIFPALRDPQPVVRACAADALSECLAVLMERQPRSMTAPLCTLHAGMMEGLRYAGPNGGADAGNDGGGGNSGDPGALATAAAIRAHGSLLVAAEMLRHSGNFVLPRYDELCVAVLNFMDHRLILIRLEVIGLIPRLVQRCPEVYARRYLVRSLDFLIVSASSSPPCGVHEHRTACAGDE